MELISGLRAFVATAQSGSFTRAGQQLGLSNRLVSKYVAALEERLDARLLQRTTRRVGLTPAGERLLARAPALLDGLDEMMTEVAEDGSGLSGVLRLSAPVSFGEAYVAPMLRRFMAANPALSVDVSLSDSYVDLAAEGVDLAFRVGESRQGALKVRKLGTTEAVLVAAPSYLAQHGRPLQLQQLSEHSCLLDKNHEAADRWLLTCEGEEQSVSVTGRYSINNAQVVRNFAVAGEGIGFSPRFVLGDDLSTGRLERVLPAYSSPEIPVSVVYLQGRVLPRKVRALIDFAVEDFGLYC